MKKDSDITPTIPPSAHTSPHIPPRADAQTGTSSPTTAEDQPPTHVLPPAGTSPNETAVQEATALMEALAGTSSPTENVSPPTPHMQAHTNTAVDQPENRQQDETTLEWFARSLAKPKEEDMSEMIRWTQQRIIKEQMVEYHARWIEKTIPMLKRLDNVPHVHDRILMKRTILLIVTADYLAETRQSVFDMDVTANRQAWTRWMKRPEIRAVYDDIFSAMESEVLNHELSAIRAATRTTRVSAARAAEVRASLLEHDNPWVQLTAARDVLQSASSDTASKQSIRVQAALSEGQVEELLARANAELTKWSQLPPLTDSNDRQSIVVVDMPTKQATIEGDDPPVEGRTGQSKHGPADQE